MTKSLQSQSVNFKTMSCHLLAIRNVKATIMFQNADSMEATVACQPLSNGTTEHVTVIQEEEAPAYATWMDRTTVGRRLALKILF